MYYTYRITNLKENKHYYGYRNSKNKKPKEDLGIIYFSSSSDKEFIKEQKENPEGFRYKVIFSTDVKEKAQNLEVRLHKRFKVGTNENFYNRATQTHNALIGTSELAQKGVATKMNTILENGLSIRENAVIKRKETTKNYNWSIIAQKGVYTRKNTILENGLTIEEDYVKRAFNTGKNNIIDGKNSYQRSAIKIYEDRDEQYRINKSLKGAQTCRDNNIYEDRSIKHSKYQNEIQDSGLTRAQETGIKISKTKKAKFKSGELEGLKGDKNPAAVRVNIYDAEDNLMFECNGTFEKICFENHLPSSFLKRTRHSDKIIRFSKVKGMTQKFYDRYKEFEGWYARQLLT